MRISIASLVALLALLAANSAPGASAAATAAPASAPAEAPADSEPLGCKYRGLITAKELPELQSWEFDLQLPDNKLSASQAELVTQVSADLQVPCLKVLGAMNTAWPSPCASARLPDWAAHLPRWLPCLTFVYPQRSVRHRCLWLGSRMAGAELVCRSASLLPAPCCDGASRVQRLYLASASLPPAGPGPEARAVQGGDPGAELAHLLPGGWHSR